MRKLYNNVDLPTPSSIQFDNYTTHIIFAHDNNSLDTDGPSSDIDLPSPTPSSNHSRSSSTVTTTTVNTTNLNRPSNLMIRSDTKDSFSKKQKSLFKKSQQLNYSSLLDSISSGSGKIMSQLANGGTGGYFSNIFDFSPQNERYFRLSAP